MAIEGEHNWSELRIAMEIQSIELSRPRGAMGETSSRKRTRNAVWTTFARKCWGPYSGTREPCLKIRKTILPPFRLRGLGLEEGNAFMAYVSRETSQEADGYEIFW